jgi:hypothetical protein
VLIQSDNRNSWHLGQLIYGVRSPVISFPRLQSKFELHFRVVHDNKQVTIVSMKLFRNTQYAYLPEMSILMMHLMNLTLSIASFSCRYSTPMLISDGIYVFYVLILCTYFMYFIISNIHDFYYVTITRGVAILMLR